MSDIQEEQKRLYKRAEENDIKLLQEENNRLNNIISEALGIANERINYYYHNKNDELLKEWEEIFEKLVKRDTELKGDNK